MKGVEFSKLSFAAHCKVQPLLDPILYFVFISKSPSLLPNVCFIFSSQSKFILIKECFGLISLQAPSPPIPYPQSISRELMPPTLHTTISCPVATALCSDDQRFGCSLPRIISLLLLLLLPPPRPSAAEGDSEGWPQIELVSVFIINVALKSSF